MTQDVPTPPRSVLIVSGCSATKSLPAPAAVGFEELANLQSRAALFERHAGSLVPARELYRGRHHLSVLHSLDTWRQSADDIRLQLAIVSAGYGLLDEDDRVL